MTKTPGLLIAAPRSGAGKTTVTLGLLRALARAGRRVVSLKCGPDYIDAAFHSVATGYPSRNIDSWAMRADLFDQLVGMARKDGDLILCEALMGLFDGVQTKGTIGNGSSADISARTGWPVILVLDVSGHAQTAAAIALGFAKYREDVTIAGVILNRVGSERHRKLTADAIEAIGLPVLGALPKSPDVALPERHLGLVQAGETEDLDHILNQLADWVSQHVDMDQVVSCALPGHASQSSAAALTPPAQRIALAQDSAFSFLYPHILDGWRDAGAEIIPFSPLNDEAPDPSCDFCWLPGGYPELHAGQLANNQKFTGGLRTFAESGAVHGECGGFMVLGQSLTEKDGTEHKMVGLLSHSTSFAKRKLNLGYRRAHVVTDFALGERGAMLSGHEFHYSTMTEPGKDDPLVELFDANGQKLPQTGGKRGRVSGTYFHMIDQISA